MKKVIKGAILALSLSILSPNAMAMQDVSPLLDTVSFQLSAEQWATSTTAKVVVGINATLSDAQLGAMHNTIMGNLSKIAANVDWHITQFQRSKNQSGLEQLYAEAEARIPENALTSLRQNADSISKPGETYTINAIDYAPSAAEIEKVRAELRSQIYDKVEAELVRLNKVYSDEKFHLHSIDFTAATPVPVPMMRTMLVAESNAAPAPAMAVSNKVMVDADVVLASTYTSTSTG